MFSRHVTIYNKMEGLKKQKIYFLAKRSKGQYIILVFASLTRNKWIRQIYFKFKKIKKIKKISKKRRILLWIKRIHKYKEL